MVDALRRADIEVRDTRYPDLQDECWTRTFADPALFAWFLEHRLSDQAAKD